MARPRAKRMAVNSSSIVQKGSGKTYQEVLPVEKKLLMSSSHEVERRITAIQAIRDAEIEHLLMQLRLLRSMFSNEQLNIPALDFFKDNLPNISVIANEKDGVFELARNAKPNYADERNMHTLFQHRKSMACPHGASVMPDFSSGFEFSSRAVQTNFLAAAGLQFPEIVLPEPSEPQKLGLEDTLRTPSVTGHRLSAGMTPKTLRLPKHGEMLLSVHGSPLGMYKEENMEVIDESEEG